MGKGSLLPGRVYSKGNRMNYDHWLTSDEQDEYEYCEIHSYTYNVMYGCQDCRDDANDSRKGE